AAYAGAQRGAGTIPRPGPGSAAGVARDEAAKREARLRARFERLPVAEREAMWATAEAQVRREFGRAWANLGYADRRPPEGALWAEIFRMVEEAGEGHEGGTATGGPSEATAADAGMAPLPSSPFDAGRRFVAWAAEEFGIDPRAPGRAPALAAVRRRRWRGSVRITSRRGSACWGRCCWTGTRSRRWSRGCGRRTSTGTRTGRSTARSSNCSSAGSRRTW